MNRELIKKILFGVVAAVCIGTIVALGFTRPLTRIAEGGHAVAALNNIERTLNSGDGGLTELIPVTEDEMIYSGPLGYYVGEKKVPIDKEYPLYIEEGTKLRFLNEENWLISADVDVVRSYEGLYLSDGHTYGSDFQEADPDEFILLTVGKDLFINAQAAKFTNPTQSTDIPVNSIIRFSETNIRWYIQEEGVLIYHEEENVFDSVISIGDHSYYYADFIRALGLIKEGINDLEEGTPGGWEKIDEAGKILAKSGADYKKRQDSPRDHFGEESPEGYSTTAVSGTADSGSDAAQHNSEKDEKGEKGSAEKSSVADEIGGLGAALGGLGSADGDEPRFKADTKGQGSVSPYRPNPIPSPDTPYSKPVIKLGKLEGWCYAVTGHLYMSDPSRVLAGNSTRITAFKQITGGGGSAKPYVNDEGYTAYPAYTADGSTAYEGKNGLARKTFNDDTDFALATLPPGSIVYIQVQFRYNKLMSDGSYSREIEYSDIIEMKLPEVKDCNITPLLSDWTMGFAERQSSVNAYGFTIKNVSAYDPQAKFSIENFKLNIAPYVNRVEYTFKSESGAKYVARVSTKSVNEAISGKSVNFEVPSDRSLPSDSKYVYSITAYDKYDNVMDLLVGKNKESAVSSENYSGEVYTRKAEPSAVYVNSDKTKENFTIKVTLTDKDDSIISDDPQHPLKLVINDVSTGASTGISGTLDGQEINYDDGIIPLPYKKADGNGEREYVVVIRSFAYGNTYSFDLIGSYDPQPDALAQETDPQRRLDKYYDVVLQTKAFATDQITGFIDFDTACAVDSEGNVLNNQHAAYIDYTVSCENSLKLLKIINEFRFTLKLGKEEIETVGINKDAVNALPVDYTADEFELIHRTPISSGVYLTYTETGIARKKEVLEGHVWDALLPTERPDEETGELTVLEPILRLEVRTPDKDSQGQTLNYLKSFTKYSLSAESVVYQNVSPTRISEYSVRTSLSMDSFYTSRELPEIRSSEFYVGPDSMTMKDMYISDPDDTIKGNGIVYVYLYRGSNIIATRTVYAKNDPNDLYIGGLLKGIEYNLKFIAPYYDDTVEGVTPKQQVLYNRTFLGSDSLYGDMNLEKIEYGREGENAKIVWLTPGLSYEENEITGETGFTKPAKLSGEYIKNALLASKDGYTGEDKRTDAHRKWLNDTAHKGNILSEYFELPNADTDTDSGKIRYLGSDLTSVASTSGKYTSFYDSDYKLITNVTSSKNNPRVLVEVPENARYVRISLPDPVADGDNSSYLDDNELELYYYLGGKRENLWKESNFVKEYVINTDGTESYSETEAYIKVKVEPGQIYHIDSAETVMMFSGTMSYMGSTLTEIYNSPLEIPKNGGYLVINISDGDYSSKKLSLVSSASGDADKNRFKTEIALTVKDENNYLGDNKVISVKVERGFITGGDYSLYKTISDIPLKKTVDPEGEEQYTAEIELEDMEAEYAWKLTMYAPFEASEVTLDTLEFCTDASCYLIRSNEDLRYIGLYPFGNYLVVADFDHELDSTTRFYGTIDFLGHKITETTSGISLIASNYGTISNLVYEVTRTASGKAPIGTNYGTISNLAIQISSDISVNSGCAVFCGTNYGTISRFFVEIGGDVILYDESALFVNCNYGSVSDGHFYSLEDKGVIFRRRFDAGMGGWEENASGILCYVNRRGVFERIYIKSDIWLDAESRDEETPVNGAVVIAYVEGGIVRNIYFSGEEYAEERTQTGEGSYTYSKGKTFVNTDHMFKASGGRGNGVTGSADMKNIWHVSRSTSKVYTCYHSFVRESSWAQLYNGTWHKEILGDAFAVEDCLGLDFYPRLILPSYMDKYQQYSELPSLDIGIRPELVNVSWAPSPYTHSYDKGDILLKFYNPNNTRILSVNISGLGNFTIDGTVLSSGKIVDTISDNQGTDKDGLWTVYLKASVDDELSDQYLSRYMITEYTYLGGDPVSLSYNTDGFEFWKLVDRACPEDVSTVTGACAWSEINDNIRWNYIIAEDIDFQDVQESLIRISGGGYDINSEDTSKAFTGKINGEYNGRMHTLENISIDDNGIGSNMPSVIRMASGGVQISNLIIDNMTIKSSLAPNYNYAGFVGYFANTNSGALAYFNNVHVVDSSVTAQGSAGTLVGYGNGISISDCSAGECELGDLAGTVTSRFGGLAGNLYQVHVTNSYVRNISAELNSNKSIQGVGGIAGNISGTASDVVNCYTTGKLVVTGENIGGIVGNTSEDDYIHIDRCWSYMTLDTIGTHTGGIVGRLSYEVNNNFALGSIYSTDTDYTHRITGRLPETGELHRNFAYEKQYVTGKTASDYDGAFRMISPEEVILSKTWADIISIGDAYDLHYVEGITKGEKTYYYFPKLYTYSETGSSGTLVWGQDGHDLGIPSVTGEHTIEVDEALYTPAEPTSGKKQNYKVAFYVNHPGYKKIEDPESGSTINEFIEKFRDGDVKINIKGLGGAADGGNFTYSRVDSIESYGETGESTFIVINTDSIYEIHTVYRLSISYQDENNTPVELAVDIQFRTQAGEDVLQYYEIKNWNDWCKYIVGRDPDNNYKLIADYDPDWKTHGRTNENVKISGWIDMSQMEYIASERSEIFGDFYGFSFDRLVGEPGTGAGFGLNSITGDKFVFEANAQGEPWITEVNTLLDNLTFKGIVVNFDNPGQTVKRDRTGFILNTRKVTNLTIEDVQINVSSYNINYAGFFSRVTTSIEDCYLKDLSIKQTNPLTVSSVTGSYSAALCAEIYNGFKNIGGENVTVELPRNSYVGAIAGYISNKNNESVSTVYSDNAGGQKLTGIHVHGAQDAGGIVGFSYLAMRNITLEDIDILSEGGGAGGAAANIGRQSTWTLSKWITVKGGRVRSVTGRAGGIVANGGANLNSEYYMNNCHAENLDITGTSAGGIAGYVYQQGSSDNHSHYEVIGCNITATNGAAGGICSDQNSCTDHDMVVRDTTITATGNAGGICGSVGYYGATFYRCYIGEDVVIRSTGTNGYAGGVVGAYRGSATCAVYDSACGADIYGATAGGITGDLVCINSNGYPRYVRNCYFSGTVHGTKRAGGIIGLYSNYLDDSTSKIRKFQPLTSANFANNVLTGSVWCEGEKVDAAYNLLCPDGSQESLDYAKTFTGTSYTCTWDDTVANSASMNVWNQSVINGRTVESKDSSAGKTTMTDAGAFRETSWWTARGFSDTIWTITDEGALTEYMPYIRNTWAYYNTGFTSGEDLGVEMDFRLRSLTMPSSWCSLFATHNAYEFMCQSGYFYYGYNPGEVKLIPTDLNHRLVRMNLNKDRKLQLYEYNDEGTASLSIEKAITQKMGSGVLRIFGNYGNNGYYSPMMDVYSVKITKDQKQAAEYIPCWNACAMQTGFYDLETGKFLLPTGGILTAGPLVTGSSRRADLPEEYTQLEYLSTYGAKYYASHDLEGNVAGIKLPPLGGNPDATKVYASGVDCLNIETTKGRTGVSVTFTGTSKSGDPESFTNAYDADENGVISLEYDYNHDVTVDGVTYTAESLRNTAMVDGDQWYFVDNSEKGNGAIVNSYEMLNSQLPEGLTGVPYIEGHGSEYINTGYVPKYQKTTMSMRFSVTEKNSGTTYLFGSRVCMSNYNYEALSSTLSSNNVFTMNTYRGNNHQSHPLKHSDGTIYDMYMDIRNVQMNGRIKDFGTNSSSYTIANPILLMHWMAPEGYEDWEAAHMRIYDMVLYEEGAVVRHFVPARIDETGELGLYEVIENKFYGNASGVGAFTCDSLSDDPNLDVGDLPIETDPSKLDPDIPEDYIQLEYLRSGNKQVIDTDTRFDDPSKTYGVDMYFRMNTPKASGDTPMVFGTLAGGATQIGYYTGFKMRYNNGFYKYGYIDEDGEEIYYTDAQLDADHTIVNRCLTHVRKAQGIKGRAGIHNNALFGCKYGNSATDFRCQADWTVYSCTITADDVPIAKFVPVFSTVYNKCGMYDTVRERFFSAVNASTYGEFFDGRAFARGDSVNTDKEYEYDDAGGEAHTITIDGEDYSVPAGYTPVEYVEMNAKKSPNDYFNLGMTAGGNTGVRVDFCVDSTKYTTDPGILYSLDSSKKEWGLMVGSSTNLLYYYWGTTAYTSTDTTAAHNVRHIVSMNYMKDRSVCLDGKTLVTGLSPSIADGTQNILLGKDGNRLFGGKIYSCIITQGYEAVRVLTPVIRNRDNVPGLYDCINDKLYTLYLGGTLDVPGGLSKSAYIARQGEAVDLDNVQVLHLWQSSKERTAAAAFDDAKCIDSEGNIYRLYYDGTEGKVKGEALGPVGATGTRRSDSQPFAEMNYTFKDRLDSRKTEEEITWLDDDHIYAKLDYIYGSGTDYIDTKIKADATTKIDFTAAIDPNESGSRVFVDIVGYNSGDKVDGAFTIRETRNGSIGSVFWYMGNSACKGGNGVIPLGTNVSVTMGPEGYHVENLDSGTVTADGKWSKTPVSKDVGLTVTLMRINPSGRTYNTWGSKWYGAKLWKNIVSDGSGGYTEGNLIFDGVPAQRKTDSKLGFYDRVTGKFFPVTGSKAIGYPECFSDNGLDDINDVTGKQVDVKVFHNFSLVKAVDSDVWHRIEYRLYENNDYQMLVSPWQDSIYDSVIMRVTKADGDDTGEEATKIVSWLTASGELSSTWSIKNVPRSDIREITNSRTASTGNTKAVIIYNNGTAKVVDYEKGLLIYTQSQTFWSYVKNSLGNVLNPNTGGTDDTELTAGIQPFTFASIASVMVPSTGVARSQGNVEAIEGTSGILGGGETNDISDGTSNTSGGAETSLAVYIPGEGVYGSDGELEYKDEEITYVEGEGIYAEDELIFEEEESEEERDEETESLLETFVSAYQTGQLTGESASSELISEDEEMTDGNSDADGVSDSAVGASEKTSAENKNAAVSDAGMVILKSVRDTSEAGSTDSGQSSRDMFSDENIIRAAYSEDDSAKVYDPVTGRIGHVAENRAADPAGEKTVAEKSAEDNETDAAEAESTSESKDKGFSVNYAIGHSMTSDERNGLIYILAACGALAALLIILGIHIGRRNKDHKISQTDDEDIPA